MAFVVGSDVGRGPCNIVLDGFDSEKVGALTVRPGCIFLDGLRLGYGKEAVYEGRWRGRKLMPENILAMRAELCAKAPVHSLAFLLERERLAYFRRPFDKVFAERMVVGAAKIFGGELREGVRIVRGCGYGLTPSGDDFLAGVMYGLHVLGDTGPVDVVYKCACRGEGLSSVFLKLAHDGLFPEKLKALAGTLSRKGDVRSALSGVLAMGASSGADLAVGTLMTLENEGIRC
ncbi:MAG: DUF2877 domain-containing protein [Elusimicrobiota bacterium]